MDTLVDKVFELLFLNKEIYFKVELSVRACSVNIAQILRNYLVEDKSADSSVDYLGYLLVADLLGDTDLDL